MTITCPACKATLTIPDDRLPKGKVVSAACPRCQGKIVIDLAGSASVPGAAKETASASAPPMAPATYSEQRQPLALVCMSMPAERDQVVGTLKAEGYAAQVATGAADAIQRLRFMAYALAVIREGFGSAAGEGNPVLDHVAEMPMGARRGMHVVFISPNAGSHDSTAAFARSVNLVLNLKDLPHLADALKRSVAETEQGYRVLLDSLRAHGKG
jgi:CheY-like chemotaxis protein